MVSSIHHPAAEQEDQDGEKASDVVNGASGECLNTEEAWGWEGRTQGRLGKSDWVNFFSSSPQMNHLQEIKSSHGRHWEEQEALEWALEKLKN